MKAPRPSVTILGILLMAAAFCAATAQTPKAGGSSPYVADMAIILDKAAVAIEKSLKTNDLEALYQMFGKIKDLGLSYDTSITLPTDFRTLQGKSKDELTVLMGMYIIDGIYASIFDKRMDVLLPIGLKVEEMLGMQEDGFWSGMTKGGSRPSRRQDQIAGGLEYWTKLVRNSRQDISVLRNLVCGFYGSTLESFYLVAKMGLASGVTAEYLGFMNAQLPRLTISRDIMDAYTVAPGDGIHMELVQTLDTVSKGKVIESLAKVMTDSKGKLTEKDLRSIVSIISAVRDPLIRFQK
jgi:hypothetical protein